MRQFAVIGNPIDHSLSPKLHNFVFNKLGIDAHYSKICVDESDLGEILFKVKNNSLSGINVTLPYKNIITNLVDELNPRAKQIGSLNVIFENNGKLLGNNTDWYGFIKLLEINNINVNAKDVIVLGAGGVAKAICFALTQSGVNSIKIFNRTLEHASAFKSDIISIYSLADVEKYVDISSIIINCTSLGMSTKNSPLPISILSKNQTLIDTIYTPLKTKLLVDAEKVGAKTVNGLDMFIYQGLASLDLWFGESISTRVNFGEIKHYLEGKLC